MKKYSFLVLLCLLCIPSLAYACACGSVLQGWISGPWNEFRMTLAAFDAKLLLQIQAATASIGHSGNIESASDLLGKKSAAQAGELNAYERDDIHRRAQFSMKQMETAVREDTPMTKMNKDCSQDGATLNGLNALTGASSRRELKDLMRKHAKLDGRNERGGNGIRETRQIRRELAEKYKNLNMDQILPEKGLTYKDPKVAMAISETIALAMSPDPWPAPENLKFDNPEKAKEYKAMLIMQDILKDPEQDAIMDYISMHTGTAPAEPVWTLISKSGGINASNPQAGYPADANNNLSMADVYRAWAEHYLSPAVANGINSDNATSVMQQLLARMYLVMLDGNTALQNAVTILALKQSGAKDQIENMRTAFMNASRGANAQ